MIKEGLPDPPSTPKAPEFYDPPKKIDPEEFRKQVEEVEQLIKELEESQKVTKETMDLEFTV